MKILVTGHTGLVGREVVAHLARRGHEVVGLSRGRLEFAPDGVEQVQACLGSNDFLDAVHDVPACRYIVHCAANCDMTPGNPDVVLTNCLGTQQVLSMAEKWGSGVVFMSSISVIGKPRQTPVTEDHPLDPPSHYSATKLFGERLMDIYGRRGSPAASFRLTAPVGPEMPQNRLLPIILKNACQNKPISINGDGSRRQTYTDIRDIARAVELCIGAEASGVFNLSGGSSVSNLELARECAAMLNSSSTISLSGQPDPEDGVSWDIALQKAEEAFDYRPAYELEETIRYVARA